MPLIPVRQNCRRHGTLLLRIIALLPLVALSAFALSVALQAYRAAHEARLTDTARALATAVDAELQGAVRALETLATLHLLNTPAANDDGAFEERARLVAELLGGWIVLVDQTPRYGVPANTQRRSGMPSPSVIDPEIQAAVARVFAEGRHAVSDFFVSDLTGRPTLAVIVPVDSPGQQRRALALGFEPIALRNLLARQKLPTGTFATIGDGRLLLVAHSSDPEGRRVGIPGPTWMAAEIDGKDSTIVAGTGWSGDAAVYAIERPRLAPRWAVTVAERVAEQQAAAWGALGWLVAAGAALGTGIALVIWANRREALRDARREAEALRVGRSEIERLHGGLPAIIFLGEVAPDGSYRRTYRSGNLEGVTGWSPDQLRTVEILEELAHPDDTIFVKRIPRLLQDGEVSYDWRMRQPSGGWRVMHTLACVLTRRSDGSAEVVGYVIDITARREAEARALTAERLASLGEMAAGMAHEMKQPLQIITLAAETAQLALHDGDTTAVDERLERIIKQAARTSDIIDRVRRFARGAESDGQMVAVPLQSLVENSLKLTHCTLRDASIVVQVNLGDPPPVVRGQGLLLEQVLTNLLLNAHDALLARPATEDRRIMISAASDAPGMVTMTVADNGGGIAPEVIGRVFEPFTTTKSPDRGTGLGLSICHGLIKDMGGTIAAHNNNEGAVFIITLPDASGDATATADPAEEK